jgi:hypothetical protein
MVGFRLNRGRELAAVGAAVLLLLPAAAGANTITVDSTDDPTAAGCTLHDAIMAANNNMTVNGCATGSPSGTDTIDFSLPPASTITLAGALPDIADDVNIVGPGSGQLTIDGADMFRPFQVLLNKTASMSGLTITGGLCDNACGTQGGAILNSGTLTLTDVTVTGNSAVNTGGSDAFAEGGGIANNVGGTLHLILSTVSDNHVNTSGATTQNGASGGGLMSRGTTTLDRSTVELNSASATGTGGGSRTSVNGGGIDIVGPITLTRSTVSGNTATAQGGGTNNAARGGGIATFNAPAVNPVLDRTTVSGNSVSASDTGASASGGGILSQGPVLNVTSSTISGNSAPVSSGILLDATTTHLKNTIVSNPLGGGANCSSPSSGSLGFNLEDTNTCGFTQPTDKPSTNPMLGATLASNGGPTQTLALLTGSPAIEAGTTSPGETTDQRGLLRPSDDISVATAPGSDGSDIGAFEVQGQPFPPPPTATPPSTTTPTVTTRKKKCKKGRVRKHGKCVKKKHRR